MDNSVGSIIEEIKLQESDKDSELKLNREFEANLANLNRTINEVLSQVEKSKQEQKKLEERISKLRTQLIVEKTRRDAFSIQLDDSEKELDKLRVQCANDIFQVWKLRSSVCETVKNISDECNVWALLMKPVSTEPLPRPMEIQSENTEINEGKYKEAMERQEKAIHERDRLLSEPDKGEEFVRKLFSLQTRRRLFSSKLEEINENEPVKFSTSGAAKMKIRPIVKKNPVKMPWYQPYSVIGSISILLLYFCILREENDVDLEFTKSLYDRIQGLEKAQLLQSYKYNKEQGKSVQDIEKRLKEIEMEETRHTT